MILTSAVDTAAQSYVDNHPPDLFTAVRDGGNYGWPFCNSNPDAGMFNMPFDRDLDMNRNGTVVPVAVPPPPPRAPVLTLYVPSRR